jgi:hypothetical protein
LEVDDSVIRLNPGRHGQAFAIRVEKVMYSTPNTNGIGQRLLKKKYLNIDRDVCILARMLSPRHSSFYLDVVRGHLDVLIVMLGTQL